jgi:hypothetical protein
MELVRTRGLEKELVRKGEGEYVIDNYLVRTSHKHGALVLEVTAGIHLLKQSLNLPTKLGLQLNCLSLQDAALGAYTGEATQSSF